MYESKRQQHGSLLKVMVGLRLFDIRFAFESRLSHGVQNQSVAEEGIHERPEWSMKNPLRQTLRQ